MDLPSLGNFLGGFLRKADRNNHSSNAAAELSEPTRLLHRLNCIKLDDALNHEPLGQVSQLIVGSQILNLY